MKKEKLVLGLSCIAGLTALSSLGLSCVQPQQYCINQNSVNQNQVLTNKTKKNLSGKKMANEVEAGVPILTATGSCYYRTGWYNSITFKKGVLYAMLEFTDDCRSQDERDWIVHKMPEGAIRVPSSFIDKEGNEVGIVAQNESVTLPTAANYHVDYKYNFDWDYMDTHDFSGAEADENTSQTISEELAVSDWQNTTNSKAWGKGLFYFEEDTTIQFVEHYYLYFVSFENDPNGTINLSEKITATGAEAFNYVQAGESFTFKKNVLYTIDTWNSYDIPEGATLVPSALKWNGESCDMYVNGEWIESNNSNYNPEYFYLFDTNYIHNYSVTGEYQPQSQEETIENMFFNDNHDCVQNDMGKGLFYYPADTTIQFTGAPRLIISYENDIHGVYDRVVPNFETKDYIIPVDISNPKTINQILANIVALDSVDGNVNVELVSTDYDPTGDLTLKNYDLNVKAVDTAGNEADATFIIYVYDATAPVVTVNYGNGKTSYEIGYQNGGVNFVNNGFETLVQAGLISINDNYYTLDYTALQWLDLANQFNPNLGASNLGEKTLTFKATDHSGNSANYSFKINVVDDAKPVISASNVNQSYQTKLTNEQLKALFTISDASSYTTEIIADGYSDSYDTLGSHEVTLKATDAAGNFETKTITISVIDDKAPVIAASNVNQSYKTKLSQDDLLALFTVTDKSNVTKTIIVDGYTSMYNKKGTYTVTLKATDAVGNESTKEISINVVDDIKPTIYAGIIDFYISNIITPLTEADIKPYISVIDDYDGELIEYTLLDLNNFYTNYNKPGTYDFRINATDASGNTQTATFSVKVWDDVPPQILVFGDAVIFVDKGMTITQEMILNFLVRTTGLDISTVETVEMPINMTEVGQYEAKIVFKDRTVRKVILNVTPSTEDDKAQADIDWFKRDLDKAGDSWLKGFAEWNWINWTTVGLITFGLILIVYLFARRRRR